jgi:N-acetylglutamate synthase-like GNAT family acetyltransferase
MADERMARPTDNVRIRPWNPAQDVGWATEVLETGLAGRRQARRGEIVDVLDGEAWIAELDHRRIGIVAIRPDGPDAVELAALLVTEPGRGIGSALVKAMLKVVRQRGNHRLWAVTTNDNLAALRLYQRRGFRIAAVRPGAVDRARATLKPSIPEVAANGIPIRDEIELEIVFERDP